MHGIGLVSDVCRRVCSLYGAFSQYRHYAVDALHPRAGADTEREREREKAKV